MKLDNKNILVIGNSRTDKTRNFILPLLNNLDDNKNYVIINQGNITDIAKNKIEEAGYKVRSFDLQNISNSMKYNPLAYVKTPEDVEIIVNTFMNTFKRTQQDDGYWDVNIKYLLWVILELICFDYRQIKVEKTLTSCIEILNRISDDRSLLRKYVSNSENLHLKGLFKKHNAPDTLDNVIIGLTVNLSMLYFSQINELIANDEMDLTNFTNEKSVLFIKTIDFDWTVHSLANTLLAQVLNLIYKTENSRYTEFILDEISYFYEIDKLPLYLKEKNIMSFVLTTQTTDSIAKVKEVLQNIDEIYMLKIFDTDTLSCLAKNYADITTTDKEYINRMPDSEYVLLKPGIKPEYIKV